MARRAHLQPFVVDRILARHHAGIGGAADPDVEGAFCIENQVVGPVVGIAGQAAQHLFGQAGIGVEAGHAPGAVFFFVGEVEIAVMEGEADGHLAGGRVVAFELEVGQLAFLVHPHDLDAGQRQVDRMGLQDEEPALAVPVHRAGVVEALDRLDHVEAGRGGDAIDRALGRFAEGGLVGALEVERAAAAAAAAQEGKEHPQAAERGMRGVPAGRSALRHGDVLPSESGPIGRISCCWRPSPRG